MLNDLEQQGRKSSIDQVDRTPAMHYTTPKTHVTWSDRCRYYFEPEWLSHKTPKSRVLRSTAYLDGLRGVAAFIVYIAHSEAWNHNVDQLQYGFGYEGTYSFITLPIVRVFFTGGHAAVAVFFVISGYVLSRRPLTLIHNKSEDVYPALSSAVFRRGIRLYFPFIVTTIGFFLSWHLFGTELEWPKPQPTLLAEFSHWWREFRHFVDPLKAPSDTWFTYDFPLWTIPVEFQGSLLIFTTLLSFARIKTQARSVLTASLALFFLHTGEWQMFCFLGGSLLAEFDLFTLSGTPETGYKHQKTISIAIFVLGMYLASQPSLKDIAIASGTAGWTSLASMVPQVYLDEQWWRFWLSLSAPMLVFSISRIAVLRRGLETPWAQYLGRISFALYLVHIPVANTFGDIIFRMSGYIRPGTAPSRWDSWVVLPKAGPLGLELDFLGPQLILLPVTFYIAEVFMRSVDEGSIWLGKWLYDVVIDW